MARDLRRRRREIFRDYLTNLERDFKRLHRAARALAPYASDGEMAKTLAIQYISFWREMRLVRLRLIIPTVKVDVSGLLAMASHTHSQVGLVLHG